TPLVVDPDAVLTGTVALEPFQSVAGRDPQVRDLLRGIDHAQLSKGGLLKLWGPRLHPLPLREAFGVSVADAADHRVEHNAARYERQAAPRPGEQTDHPRTSRNRRTIRC